MNELISSMDPFFKWLLQTSAETSLLIGMVWICQKLFKPFLSARWRHILWMLVVIRLLIPAVPNTSWSLYSFVGRDRESVFESVSTSVRPITPSAGFREEHFSEKIDLYSSSLPVLSSDESSEAVEPQKTQVTLISVLAGVWLLGALGFGGGMIWQTWRFSRMVSRLRPCTDLRHLEILEDTKESMGIHVPISLVITDAVSSPALFGFLRPRLLLPQHLMNQMSAREWRHVMLHELAHLKRGDIWMNWGVAVAQVLHWFNPLVWFAFREMRADRELACDAMVLAKVDHEEDCYGETLLKFLEKGVPVRSNPALLGILEDWKQIRGRIAFIAAFNSKRQGYPLLAMAVILFLLIGTFTRPGTAEESTKTGETPTLSKESSVPLIIQGSLPKGFEPRSGNRGSVSFYQKNVFPAKMTFEVVSGKEGEFEIKVPAKLASVPELQAEIQFFSEEYAPLLGRVDIKAGTTVAPKFCDVYKKSESVHYKGVFLDDSDGSLVPFVGIFDGTRGPLIARADPQGHFDFYSKCYYGSAEFLTYLSASKYCGHTYTFQHKAGEVVDLRLTMESGVRAWVKTVDETGAPVEGVKVNWMGAGGASGTTDANGTVQLKGLLSRIRPGFINYAQKEGYEIAEDTGDLIATNYVDKPLLIKLRKVSQIPVKRSTFGPDSKARIQKEMEKMTQNPEMMKMISKKLEERLRKQYSDFISSHSLTEDQTTTFVQMLTEHSTALFVVKSQDNLIDPQKNSSGADKIKHLTEKLDAGLKSLLSNEKFTAFKAYEKTIPARTELDTFKQTLPMQELVLNPEQEKSLLSLMIEESDKLSSDPSMVNPTSEQMVSYMKQKKEQNERILSRSQKIIPEPLYLAMESFFKKQNEANKTTVESLQASPAPVAAEAPPISIPGRLIGEKQMLLKQVVQKNSFVQSSDLCQQGIKMSYEQKDLLEQKVKDHEEDLESRIKLLGFYFLKKHTQPELKRTMASHVLWIIQNCPDSEIAGMPQMHLDSILENEEYEQSKKLWQTMIDENPKNVKILANAGTYFTLHDKELARSCFEKAVALEPSNLKLKEKFTFFEILDLTHLRITSESEAKSLLARLEKIDQSAVSDWNQVSLHLKMAQMALAVKEWSKAEQYAVKTLDFSKESDSTGIFGANLVLGHLALQKNDIEKAKTYLYEAGKTKGSAALGSFGPNMGLAKALLERGEKDAVLNYFTQCAAFWKSGADQLKGWSFQVKQGEVPDFGANLEY